MPEGTPIGPRNMDARAYRQDIKRSFLDPFVGSLAQKLDLVGGIGELSGVIDSNLAIALSAPSVYEDLSGSVGRQGDRLSAYHRQRTRETLGRLLAVDIDPVLNDDAIRRTMAQWQRENIDLISTLPETLSTGLKKRLGETFLEKPFDRQAVRETLAKEYNVTGSRLKLITRDQTSKAVGRLTRARHQQLGIAQYRWRSVGDNAVRDEHRALDGVLLSWDETPPGGEHPGGAIQCFVGESLVLPAGLQASVSYRYVGEVVEIGLASGVKTTVTPNHPILTKAGWKRACDIEKADELFVHRGRGDITASTGEPKTGNRYARAEDLHRLHGGLACEDRPIALGVDLHGAPRRRDEEVEVIATPGVLRDGFDALAREVFANLGLKAAAAAQTALLTLGEAMPLLESTLAATSLGVSGSGQGLPLVGRRPGHSQVHGSRPIPGWQTQVAEAGLDDRATPAELLGDLLDGPIGIPECLNVRQQVGSPLFVPFSATGLAGGGMRNAQVVQAHLNGVVSDTQRLADLGHVAALFRESTDFAQERVAWKRLRHHDAPVYNFETSTGIIIANGIVTHNCRCVAIPVVDGEELRRQKEQAEEQAEAARRAQQVAEEQTSRISAPRAPQPRRLPQTNDIEFLGDVYDLRAVDSYIEEAPLPVWDNYEAGVWGSLDTDEYGTQFDRAQVMELDPVQKMALLDALERRGLLVDQFDSQQIDLDRFLKDPPSGVTPQALEEALTAPPPVTVTREVEPVAAVQPRGSTVDDLMETVPPEAPRKPVPQEMGPEHADELAAMEETTKVLLQEMLQRAGNTPAEIAQAEFDTLASKIDFLENNAFRMTSDEVTRFTRLRGDLASLPRTPTEAADAALTEAYKDARKWRMPKAATRDRLFPDFSQLLVGYGREDFLPKFAEMPYRTKLEVMKRLDEAGYIAVDAAGYPRITDQLNEIEDTRRALVREIAEERTPPPDTSWRPMPEQTEAAAYEWADDVVDEAAAYEWADDVVDETAATYKLTGETMPSNGELAEFSKDAIPLPEWPREIRQEGAVDQWQFTSSEAGVDNMLKQLKPEYQRQFQELMDRVPPTIYGREEWAELATRTGMANQGVDTFGIHLADGHGVHLGPLDPEPHITVPHELGHAIDQEPFANEFVSEMYDLYRKRVDEGNVFAVTPYGAQDPGEFVGETVGYFIGDNAVLKARDPEAYDLVSTHLMQGGEPVVLPGLPE